MRPFRGRKQRKEDWQRQKMKERREIEEAITRDVMGENNFTVDH